MMGKEIRLRPHHGLCIQHYTGQGYSNQFIENMDYIVKTLKDNPKQEIILCVATDVLCDFCPNKQDGAC